MWGGGRAPGAPEEKEAPGAPGAPEEKPLARQVLPAGYKHTTRAHAHAHVSTKHPPTAYLADPLGNAEELPERGHVDGARDPHHGPEERLKRGAAILDEGRVAVVLKQLPLLGGERGEGGGEVGPLEAELQLVEDGVEVAEPPVHRRLDSGVLAVDAVPHDLVAADLLGGTEKRDVGWVW